MVTLNELEDITAVLLGRLPLEDEKLDLEHKQASDIISFILIADEFNDKIIDPVLEGKGLWHSRRKLVLTAPLKTTIATHMPLGGETRKKVLGTFSWTAFFNLILNDPQVIQLVHTKHPDSERARRWDQIRPKFLEALQVAAQQKPKPVAPEVLKPKAAPAEPPLGPKPQPPKPAAPAKVVPKAETAAPSEVAETKKPLTQPPQEGSKENCILNGGFEQWPQGLRCEILERQQETAQNWHVDFRKSAKVKAGVRLEQGHNLGRRGNAYGLRLSVMNVDQGGYFRLFCKMDAALLREGRHCLSLEIKIPQDASLGNIHIAEIFLGTLEKQNLVKIVTLRKKLMTRNVLKVRVDGIHISEAYLKLIEQGAEPIIAFDIQGTGDLVLFEPKFAAPIEEEVEVLSAQGVFEDQHIQNQVKLLKLSSLWDANRPISQIKPMPVVKKPVGTASPNTPFIQIIIPIFNAIDDVQDCVLSILDHTHSPFEILLCDDGSEAYTQERLKDLVRVDPRLKLFLDGENVGYTRNINRAARRVSADYMVLLNSDTVVTRGWLDKLYHTLMVSKDTVAVGPLSNAASWQSVPETKDASGAWAVNPLLGGVSIDQMGDLVEQLSQQAFPAFPLLNGFCTLFRGSALEKVGFFNEEAFPQGYGEENDLCLRLRKAGYKLRVADDTYVYHKKSRSFGVERRSELSKKSNTVLRQIHATVNFNNVEAEMRQCAPLNALRTALSERLQIEMDSLKPDASAPTPEAGPKQKGTVS